MEAELQIEDSFTAIQYRVDNGAELQFSNRCQNITNPSWTQESMLSFEKDETTIEFRILGLIEDEETTIDSFTIQASQIEKELKKNG